MPLSMDQATKKSDVFKEIKKKYAKYTGVDKQRYWKEQDFTFKPPKKEWLDELRVMGQRLEVELRYAGDLDRGEYRVQRPGAFTVQLTGQSKQGGSVTTAVGTIQEDFK